MSDLNEMLNLHCAGGCNKEKRSEETDADVCRRAPSTLDQLPVRCVGNWARKKIQLLAKYFGIFSIGMKNKWNGKINYIEICSGPGRCILREEQMEIDGTALAIINSDGFRFIQKALFIDFDSAVIEILNKRIQATGKAEKAKAIHGDYNDPEALINAIRSHIGYSNCLNLLFIDPTDCSFPFSTLVALKEALPNVDLIINFAMLSDMIRNIRGAILSPESHAKVRQKYLDFLGDQTLFDGPAMDQLARQPRTDDLLQAIIAAYEKSLQSLGYQYFDKRSVGGLYHIWFASAVPKGLEFWKKAHAIEDQQRTFLFG